MTTTPPASDLEWRVGSAAIPALAIVLLTWALTVDFPKVTNGGFFSDGATYYSLGVRDLTTTALVVDSTTTGTSYAAALSPGRSYRWNVAACNAAV